MDNDNKFELIDYIVKFGIISNVDIIKPSENKTILTDEEIEILRLRKHLTKNSLSEISVTVKLPSLAPNSGTRITSLSFTRQRFSSSKRAIKIGALCRKTWSLFAPFLVYVR
jgi:hypothetical protein